MASKPEDAKGAVTGNQIEKESDENLRRWIECEELSNLHLKVTERLCGGT